MPSLITCTAFSPVVLRSCNVLGPPIIVETCRSFAAAMIRCSSISSRAVFGGTTRCGSHRSRLCRFIPRPRPRPRHGCRLHFTHFGDGRHRIGCSTSGSSKPRSRRQHTVGRHRRALRVPHLCPPAAACLRAQLQRRWRPLRRRRRRPPLPQLCGRGTRRRARSSRRFSLSRRPVSASHRSRPEAP